MVEENVWRPESGRQTGKFCGYFGEMEFLSSIVEAHIRRTVEKANDAVVRAVATTTTTTNHITLGCSVGCAMIDCVQGHWLCQCRHDSPIKFGTNRKMFSFSAASAMICVVFDFPLMRSRCFILRVLRPIRVFTGVAKFLVYLSVHTAELFDPTVCCSVDMELNTIQCSHTMKIARYVHSVRK